MNVSEIIEEAIQFGSMNDASVDLKYIYAAYVDGSTKIADVDHNLSLYKKDNWYSLLKNNIDLVGYTKISSQTIAGKRYSHVDLIYILPEYRNGTAIKWLLYAIKEKSEFPIIADGAIFKGGQSLINSLIRHNASLVCALNKNTGEKSKISEPINDVNYCYLFESTNLGFGNIIGEFNDKPLNEGITKNSPGWVWYPLFEEF